MAKVYDAVVVGSGANGGWAAKELCEAGLDVVMLEAGSKLKTSDFSDHVLPYEKQLRGRRDPRNPAFERRPIGKKCYACQESNAEFFLDEIDNPFTAPEDKPFWWIRGNQVGGRTLMWGRQSYRMSDWDFKAASRDGYGDDWPISYADLSPYYDRVERFIGVSGQREGWDILPDGQFLPPMKMSCGEQMMRESLAGRGRRMTIGRVAVNTVRHNGRAACHYCGPCFYGCVTRSYFSSPVSTLPAAEKTGNFTLVTQAMVRQVTLDSEGRAKGIAYVDTDSSSEHEVEAKVVVLCASTLGSTRILLASGGEAWSEGLGNASGVLGRYLMDHHFQSGARGALPLRNGAKAELARRPNGIYVPRFRNLAGKDPDADFIRGYGYQGGERVTIYEHAYSQPGFGAEFKESVRGDTRASLSLGGFGETLAYADNRATLDPKVKDKWGIPALRIECTYRDNEHKMNADMAAKAADMLESVGCEDVSTYQNNPPPGFCIHEVGTARMGDDPKSSFVNQFQQSHEIKNLFVMDGSSHVTIGCVNPTLTMMALATRSSEYLVGELKRGNLA